MQDARDNASRPARSEARSRLRVALLILCVWPIVTGCAAQRYLVERSEPASALAMQLKFASVKGPSASERTENLLRRFDLSDLYKKDARACLEGLQQLSEQEPSSDLNYAVSELAYILGKRAESKDDEALALDMYGVAVSNAYMFLFAPEFDLARNPYDPQFRGACDVYNESLEATLRLVNAKGQLKPGFNYSVTTGKQTYEVATTVKGNWRNEDFERFEFVSDYKLEGLAVSGVTYGLGVPLIAVRRERDESDPREKYYPEGLSFPVTALLRVVPRDAGSSRKTADHRHHCVLELHDPLAASDLQLAGRLVPLQTDLSTALAYFLDSPQFREKNQATVGLLNPNKTQGDRGIYMVEPFDPNRIPVLMVHGVWSSPVTWMPMFNDLRSFTELRKNYQCWFYHYPTGQPFWVCATQLRKDLETLRQGIDPDHRYPALDQMVLVGHSMGGLLCRLQTIESGNEFWSILSNQPFETLKGKPADLQLLREAAFFHPNRSIRRVVTIGTPHRGSKFANDTTRWLGRQFIKLPTMMVSTGQELINANPNTFRATELLTTNTSIDSLSEDSPVFPAMLRAPRATWVTYNNIVGEVPKKSILGQSYPSSDGVVAYESAHADDAASEIKVLSEHGTIHRTPKAILEVRRILLAHLDQVRSEQRVADRLHNSSPQRLSTEKPSIAPEPSLIQVSQPMPDSQQGSGTSAAVAPWTIPPPESSQKLPVIQTSQSRSVEAQNSGIQ